MQKHVTVANTIRQQLGEATLASVAAKRFAAVTSPRPGLQFNVRGRRRFVTVSLTPGDLYDVRLWTLVSGTLVEKTIAQVADVPVQNLRLCVFSMAGVA